MLALPGWMHFRLLDAALSIRCLVCCIISRSDTASRTHLGTANVISPLIAKARAAGNQGEVQRLIGEAIFLASTTGLIGMFLLTVVPDMMLNLVLPAGAAARQYATPYLACRGISYVPAAVSSVAFSAFRGVLDVMTPLKVSAATNLVNMVLDPFLIFTCGGWQLNTPVPRPTHFCSDHSVSHAHAYTEREREKHTLLTCHPRCVCASSRNGCRRRRTRYCCCRDPSRHHLHRHHAPQKHGDFEGHAHTSQARLPHAPPCCRCQHPAPRPRPPDSIRLCHEMCPGDGRHGNSGSCARCDHHSVASRGDCPLWLRERGWCAHSGGACQEQVGGSKV